MLSSSCLFATRRSARSLRRTGSALLLGLALPLTPRAASVAFAAAGAANSASIRLSAERTVLRPDGRSTTVITAQVFDENGATVPDNTRVRFSTTAGRLNADVLTTQSGIARVTLTAADQPGEATVVAVVESPGQSVPVRIDIVFSEEADQAQTGANWMRITGTGYVGYAADYKILQANGKDGGAKLSYHNLTLSADALQMNLDVFQNDEDSPQLEPYTIRATGNVILTRAGRKLTYQNLQYNLQSGEGKAERILEDGKIADVELHTARGSGLITEAALPPGAPLFGREDWAFADISASQITLKTLAMAIDPNNIIQFRRAEYYVDGQKWITLPYHVLSLAQGSLFQDQIVGYGSTGITFDLPFYYDVRPSDIGTLHLRRIPQVGDSGYAARPGWQLDLVQSYNGAHNVDGSFEAIGLTRSDWGVRLRHGQRLDSTTTGSLFVDLPNHRNLLLSTQAQRTYRTFSLNGTLTGSHTPAYTFGDDETATTTPSSSSIGGQLYAETYDRAFWGVKAVRYVVNAGVGRQNYYGGSVTGGSAGNRVDTRSVSGRLFTRPVPIGQGTTLTQSFTLGQVWVRNALGSDATVATNNNVAGVSVLGTTTLNRNLVGLGTATLSYDYAETPLTRGPYAGSIARHRLALNSYLTGKRRNSWQLDVTASQALEISQSTLIGNLRLPLGPLWGLRFRYSASRYGGFGNQDMLYALTRRIAQQEVSLFYSTTYRRVQLDFSGARF